MRRLILPSLGLLALALAGPALADAQVRPSEAPSGGAASDPDEQRAPAGPALDLRLDAPPSREVYRLNLGVDIPVIVTGTAAGLVRILFAGNLIRITCAAACDPNSVNAFDRPVISSNYSSAADLASSITVGLAVGAPPLLDLLDVGMGKAFGQDLVVYAEAMAVNTVVTQIANFGAARPRPVAYLTGADRTTPNNYLSFWSGHASNTVTALTAAAFTMRLRYGEMVWPWVVVGVVGASVSAERVLAGSHFPTDVIAGSLAGLAVGIAVPWLHARGPAMTFVPIEGGRGVAVGGSF
jgi:membrane-associated phospholipid phosphatase